MSAHKLGVHWIPVHNRRGDVEYIRRLQPRSVKIVNPDVQQVSDAFLAAPGALFVLRDHALSEQHGDVARDPVGTGVRHARELAAWVGRMEGQARERGLPFPGRERIITPGLNEGKVWEALEAVALYNVALCEEGTRLGARMLAGNLSVGWPGDGGAANTPPDWRPFAGLHDAILGGPHMLGFHEYFGQQGPEFYGDWWFNRIGQCPWRGARWEGRMLCGELGMARAFQHADGSWGLDGGRGWVGLVDGATYVAMVRRALQVYRADRRIYDAQLFTTDGTTEHWHTFETESIHDQLVAMAMGLAGEPLPVEPLPGEGSGAGHTVNLPVVIAPPAGAPPATPPEPADPDNWRRSREFVKRWEGGWANHPADVGGPTNKGITMPTLRRWRLAQGMGEPSVDDLRALSDGEADAIYHQFYWQASGADKLPWPGCLVLFDTAVLHGATVAQWFRDEVGRSALGILGLRLLSYAAAIDQEPSQAAFWEGWRRRTMELRKVVRLANGQPV